VTLTNFERHKQCADRIVTEARLRRGLTPLAHSVWSLTTPTLVGLHQLCALYAAGSGYRGTALKHALISLRRAPFLRATWAVLGRAVLPPIMKDFLKKGLISAGLWKAAH